MFRDSQREEREQFDKKLQKKESQNKLGTEISDRKYTVTEPPSEPMTLPEENISSCGVQTDPIDNTTALAPESCSEEEYKFAKDLTPFFRTDVILYHKFENMVIFGPGKLYSLCSP